LPGPRHQRLAVWRSLSCALFRLFKDLVIEHSVSALRCSVLFCLFFSPSLTFFLYVSLPPGLLLGGRVAGMNGASRRASLLPTFVPPQALELRCVPSSNVRSDVFLPAKQAARTMIGPAGSPAGRPPHPKSTCSCHRISRSTPGGVSAQGPWHLDFFSLEAPLKLRRYWSIPAILPAGQGLKLKNLFLLRDSLA